MELVNFCELGLILKMPLIPAFQVTFLLQKCQKEMFISGSTSILHAAIVAHCDHLLVEDQFNLKYFDDA